MELAIQYGHYYIFDKLLNHPDIKLKGPDSVSRWRGNSPIQICAKFGRNRMLQILFEKKKADININYCNMEVHTLQNQQLTPKEVNCQLFIGQFSLIMSMLSEF